MTILKLKICGITGKSDAELIQSLGGWAIGFIFFKGSKRYIKPEKAFSLSKDLRIERVGVFVNEEVETISIIAKIANLSIIQLHGDETADFCKELKAKTNLPIIKAIRVKDKTSLEQIKDYKDIVFAVLLDSYDKDLYGGTGKQFDVELAIEAKKYNIPLIIAGGVNANNIHELQEKINPFAFDLSSAVEISKGIKDSDKLKDLFKNT